MKQDFLPGINDNLKCGSPCVFLEENSELACARVVMVTDKKIELTGKVQSLDEDMVSCFRLLDMSKIDMWTRFSGFNNISTSKK